MVKAIVTNLGCWLSTSKIGKDYLSVQVEFSDGVKESHPAWQRYDKEKDLLFYETKFTKEDPKRKISNIHIDIMGDKLKCTIRRYFDAGYYDEFEVFADKNKFKSRKFHPDYKLFSAISKGEHEAMKKFREKTNNFEPVNPSSTEPVTLDNIKSGDSIIGSFSGRDEHDVDDVPPEESDNSYTMCIYSNDDDDDEGEEGEL